MNLYYVVTFLARSASALALLVCLITVYGEKLPSRNRFCVATKIPIELIGFEASLAQWYDAFLARIHNLPETLTNTHTTGLRYGTEQRSSYWKIIIASCSISD